MAKQTAIINVALSSLFGKAPATLFEILNSLSLTHDVKRTVVNALERRLQTQQVRSMGKALGHTLTKQLDSTLDNKQLTQLTIAQKRVVAEALANNLAIQLIKCAELITEYPPFQEVVVLCKENPDALEHQDLATARMHRDNAANAIHTCLVNLGRIYAGQPPVPVEAAPAPAPHVVGPTTGDASDGTDSDETN